MKKQIEPLQRSEIIRLDKVMTTIRYTVKRFNISQDMRSGYCKIRVIDFDNENIFLEIEAMIGDEIGIEKMRIDRKTMQPIGVILFNPENN